MEEKTAHAFMSPYQKNILLAALNRWQGHLDDAIDNEWFDVAEVCCDAVRMYLETLNMKFLAGMFVDWEALVKSCQYQEKSLQTRYNRAFSRVDR